MKKKLFLVAVMAFIFAVVFAFAVSADTIHTPERLAKYGTTVTVRVTADDPDGTTVNLFDAEGNALLWYLDSSNQLQSIRTDDQRVQWYTESWDEVTSVSIVFSDGTTTTTINRNKFVVVNMLDDDVVKNAGPNATKYYGKPVTNFKHVFNDCPNLEYLYLRLDTNGFYQTSFTNASKLKYINVEDLTLLKNSRGGQQFSGCTSLLAGQVFDLSNTILVEITGGGMFAKAPIAGLILPSVCKSFDTWAFQDNPTTSFRFYAPGLTYIPDYTFNRCTNLQTVYLGNSFASVGSNAFNSCNSLTTVCFTGTKDQLKTLIANTSSTGNSAFLNVAGALGSDGEYANVISYEDYLKLSNEEKSGKKFAIYNYSYCEAFNGGVHTAANNAVDCTKDADCSVCLLKGVIESQFTEHNYLEAFVYENGFAQVGVYTSICQNAAYCTCGNVTAEKTPLFVADGFSTKGTDGISAGYTVNPDLIAEYNRINSQNPISFGVMMVSPTFLAGKDSFFAGGKVNAEKYLQVDMTDVAYKNLSVYITGFVDSARNASLVMALYVCDGENNVELIQSQTTSCADKKVTLGETTLYTVTLDSVTNENTTVPTLKDYFAKEEE